MMSFTELTDSLESERWVSRQRLDRVRSCESIIGYQECEINSLKARLHALEATRIETPPIKRWEGTSHLGQATGEHGRGKLERFVCEFCIDDTMKDLSPRTEAWMVADKLDQWMNEIKPHVVVTSRDDPRCRTSIHQFSLVIETTQPNHSSQWVPGVHDDQD